MSNVEEIAVSNPQDEILRSTKQRILGMAGQGGGKSHTAGLLSADFVINYPHVRGFIGANTYQQLSKSTLDRVFSVWKTKLGWTEGVEYVVDKIPPAHYKKIWQKLKTYENTICFNNGAMIFTASLDNYKAIDGTEFGWAILDETKDTKEEAVKEVITGRLRQVGLWVKDGVVYTDQELAERVGAASWNPLYILTSPAKVDWINEWFEITPDKYPDIRAKIFTEDDYYSLETEDKHVVIYSTYHNQDNLPSGYIPQRKKDLVLQNLIEMLVYGSPMAKSGGEFYSQFEILKHVGKVDFLPGVNVHISLDFNVVPYITMTCWQIERKENIYIARCFDEFCLSSPKNNTEALCNEFKYKYIEPYERNGKKFPDLFYYGDSTGKNQSTVSTEHNFDILERTLKKWLNDESDRVVKRNPSVSGTRDFVNKIYAEGLPIRILISDRCNKLIADNEFLKEGPDGGKLIVHETDKITKQKYEKYGHPSDSKRYFLVSAFGGYYEKD